MKTKSLNLLLLCIVFCIILTGFYADKKDGIPPDFKGYNGTLLVRGQSKDWDKYLVRHFDENYKGKYEFMGIDTTKYADILQYRFILGRNLHFHIDPKTDMEQRYASSENLYMEDRQTGLFYFTKKSAYYGKLLKAYSLELEEARSNQ